MKLKLYSLISFLILFTSCHRGNDWGFVEMLPDDAIVLNEYKWSDRLLAHYDYYLKAKMSKSGFLEYAKELELTEHYEGRIYEDKDWTLDLVLSGDIEWWKPNFNDSTPLYIWQGADEWIVVKYQNGIMFLHGEDR